MMNKPYTLVNRKTGKSVLKFATREQARIAKRERGFKHSILNVATNTIVR